jgi:hypothetical protein
MINYISKNYCVTTFARSGSTSVLNWCYYLDNNKIFNGQDYGYGSSKILGSGIHWYYLYNLNYNNENLYKQNTDKILLLRDPIERFISAFNFLKVNNHNNINEKLIHISIEDFIINIDKFIDDKFVKIHIEPFSTYLNKTDKKHFTHIINFKKLIWIKNYLEKKTNKKIPQHLIHLNKTTKKNYISSKYKNILKEFYASDYEFLF